MKNKPNPPRLGQRARAGITAFLPSTVECAGVIVFRQAVRAGRAALDLTSNSYATAMSAMVGVFQFRRS